jgi:hypothetical protein
MMFREDKHPHSDTVPADIPGVCFYPGSIPHRMRVAGSENHLQTQGETQERQFAIVDRES